MPIAVKILHLQPGLNRVGEEHGQRAVIGVCTGPEMTLCDVIACGTSIGGGSMKPGSTISIIIDGIGTLTNRYE